MASWLQDGSSSLPLATSPFLTPFGGFHGVGGVTGSGARCSNYRFQYLFCSNRMCCWGSKPEAKVLATFVLRSPSEFLVSGKWSPNRQGGGGQGRGARVGGRVPTTTAVGRGGGPQGLHSEKEELVVSGS